MQELTNAALRFSWMIPMFCVKQGMDLVENLDGNLEACSVTTALDAVSATAGAQMEWPEMENLGSAVQQMMPGGQGMNLKQDMIDNPMDMVGCAALGAFDMVRSLMAVPTCMIRVMSQGGSEKPGGG